MLRRRRSYVSGVVSRTRLAGKRTELPWCIGGDILNRVVSDNQIPSTIISSHNNFLKTIEEQIPALQVLFNNSRFAN